MTNSVSHFTVVLFLNFAASSFGNTSLDDVCFVRLYFCWKHLFR